MDPRFLRDEAARFRVMAEDTEREASKLLLLAMAADYEARAVVAEGLAGVRAAEPVEEPADQEADSADEAPAEGTLKSRTGKLTLRSPKDTEIAKRRPLVRRKPA